MPQPNRQDRVNEALDQLRRELDRQGPLRPQLDQRLAGATIRPRRRFAPLAIAALALASSLIAVCWYRAPTQRPADLPAIVKVQWDQTELVQHVAALVDNAVVVVWSCRGPAVSTDGAGQGEHRVGKYRLVILRQETLSDGRIVTCSLFLPDDDVCPLLEPPSLTARGADQRLMALGASPRAISAAEFDDAARSAGLRVRLEMSEVDREIRKRVN